MDITLKQLQVFTSVARHENLTLASGQLFMTKGAVSQALQELERRLGVLLFDRAHPRLKLNHEGRMLLPMADELLHRAEDIERCFGKNPQEGTAGRFLLAGCTKSIGNYLMPELVAGFSREHGWLPNMHIVNTMAILRMLASFSLDIGLLEGEERHPDLVFEPWLTDEMVVIAPYAHRLSADAVHPVKALADERWIMREEGSGSRENFAHDLAPLIGPYSIALTLTSPAAIIESVAQGLGLTFASRRSAQHALFAGRLKIIELERTFPRTFSLCYHSRKYHSASMRDFLSYCRQMKEAE